MTSKQRDANRPRQDQRLDAAHYSFDNLGTVLDEFEIGFVRLSTSTAAVQDTNRTLGKLIGRDQDELDQKPLSHLVDAEARSRFIELVASLRQGPTRRVAEKFPISHSNRTTVWLRFTFVTDPNADEYTAVVNATVIDVSRSESLEEELRLANDRFDSAQKNSRVGSWEWIEGEPVAWWSKQLYELHNVNASRGPVTFEDFIEMVDPKDRQTIYEVNRPPFTEGDVRRFEFSSNPAFGPRRYFAATVWMIRINGRMVRRGTTQDITRPVELRSALRKSEKQYREMVVTNAEGRAVLNVDGKILRVDEKFASMLGQQCDGLIGHNICLFAEAESAKLIEERMLRRNNSLAEEVRMSHSDGHLVWLMLTCSPLLNVSKQFIAIQAHAVDITHRKRVETMTKLAAEAKTKLKQLTIRERQVLEQIAEGRMNKVIANRLEISEKTVERHRSNMMKKLDAQSVAEVVKLFVTAEIMTAY